MGAGNRVITYLTHRLSCTSDRLGRLLRKVVPRYASPPTHIPMTTCRSFGRREGLRGGEDRVSWYREGEGGVVMGR